MLRLQVIWPCSYGARHGGASEDLSSQRRSRAEVKARGRWADERSLKRYGKQTRLQHELTKVPKSVIEFGVFVRDNLLGVLSQDIPLPALPSAALRPAKRRRQ